jgi:hypothetical protein
MVAAVPNHGGAAWAVLQYVLGLRRLGQDVILIEAVDSLDLARLQYFEQVVERFDLVGRAALVVESEHRSFGMTFDQATQALARADLLLNLAGTLRSENLLGLPARRVYVDLDPGFTQLWQAVEGIDMGFGRHDLFVTVGQAIGSEACPVPTAGVPWIPTVPPVVLEQWPFADRPATGGWSTVANWRSYGSIQAGDTHYGQKAHSFRRVLGLPGIISDPPCLALGIDAGDAPDLARLKEHGWILVDPRCVARTPDDYWQFVASSRGEIGVVKSGYVAGRTGWFSDRSACYLASGRPVVTEDTGFTDYIPAGEGLMTFHDEAGAKAAIAEVEGDYARHRKAARDLAEAVFDSDVVLGNLLDALGSSL